MTCPRSCHQTKLSADTKPVHLISGPKLVPLHQSSILLVITHSVICTSLAGFILTLSYLLGCFAIMLKLLSAFIPAPTSFPSPAPRTSGQVTGRGALPTLEGKCAKHCQKTKQEKKNYFIPFTTNSQSLLGK